LGGLLSTSEGRSAHIAAIIGLVNDNNYAGIDLDYRVLDPQDADDFAEFVSRLSEELRLANRSLSMTLPAPARQGDDWDTRGFDWDTLASRADALKVAPSGDPAGYYTQLSAAVAYLVPRVGAGKLFLTIDTLSREQSSEGLRTLRLPEALTLASTPALQADGPVTVGATVTAYAQNLSEQSGGTPLRWDPTGKAVTFTYTGGGGARGVWLANSFSATARLDLARRYQLGGVAIEDISTAAGGTGVIGAVQRFASGSSFDVVAPNGEVLQPRWSASDGTLESDAGPLVTWQAPDNIGDYTLTLVVSDGAIRIGQEISVAVGG
jgi:hypothetical protein